MQTQEPTRATMTIEEVAAVFGLARSTAYDLARTDRLPVPIIRAGKRVFVSRTLVERVLAGEDVRRTGDADRRPEMGPRVDSDAALPRDRVPWDPHEMAQERGPNGRDDPPGMGTLAAAYTSHGCKVLPLHSPTADGRCSCRRDCGRDGGKHPRTPNGLTDATTDPDRVRDWWECGPLPTSESRPAPEPASGCST